jgi:hypothetical protein
MIIAALGAAGSLYFIFFRDRDDFLYLFGISLLILMIAYVFQYQIDQIMTRGVPLGVDSPMVAMLLHTSVHFNQMSPVQRSMILDRMKRWIMRKEFINKNEQDAPEDVKYILAYYAALLTVHQQDYLYSTLDRIVFYHHPFLSPAHPDDVHIGEVEATDGTIIVSVPHLLKGHLEKGYYNLALHLMAIAYQKSYMQGTISWPGDIWMQLEEISGIEREKIESYLGLPVDDPWPVAVHHQLTYSGSYIPQVLEVFPQLED